jgi:hypothetical protein
MLLQRRLRAANAAAAGPVAQIEPVVAVHEVQYAVGEVAAVLGPRHGVGDVREVRLEVRGVDGATVLITKRESKDETEQSQFNFCESQCERASDGQRQSSAKSEHAPKPAVAILMCSRHGLITRPLVNSLTYPGPVFPRVPPSVEVWVFPRRRRGGRRHRQVTDGVKTHTHTHPHARTHAHTKHTKSHAVSRRRKWQRKTMNSSPEASRTLLQRAAHRGLSGPTKFPALVGQRLVEPASCGWW